MPSLGFLLPFYISGPRIKAVAFGKEDEEAEDRKQRGLCGAEVGFGHGWSAQPSPTPIPRRCPQPPAWSQAAATADHGAPVHTWFVPKPRQGRVAGLQGRRDS